MDGMKTTEDRKLYLVLALASAVTAIFFANEGKFDRSPSQALAAGGFAIAAGLCVLAAALVRKDRRPEEPR